MCDLFVVFFFQYLDRIEALGVLCGYWIGLGILSSVGLGTGLHTFLLYLVYCHQLQHYAIYNVYSIYIMF